MRVKTPLYLDFKFWFHKDVLGKDVKYEQNVYVMSKVNIKSSDVKDMKRTGKVKLFGWEVFWHYSIIPFLLIVPIITLWNIIQHSLGIYEGVRKPYELLDGFLFIIPAVIFYFVQRNRLKFKTYRIKATGEMFEIALDKSASELDWAIEVKKTNFIRAHRSWRGESSWGELITIIRDGDTIYINSICDPNAIFASVISYGWNRRNIITFVNNLKSLEQGLINTHGLSKNGGQLMNKINSISPSKWGQYGIK